MLSNFIYMDIAIRLTHYQNHQRPTETLLNHWYGLVFHLITGSYAIQSIWTVNVFTILANVVSIKKKMVKPRVLLYCSSLWFFWASTLAFNFTHMNIMVYISMMINQREESIKYVNFHIQSVQYRFHGQCIHISATYIQDFPMCPCERNRRFFHVVSV